MKRSSFIIAAVVLGAAAAWTGWQIGSAPPEQRASAPKRPVLPQRTALAAVVTGDYSGLEATDFHPRNGRPLSDILTMAEGLRFSPALTSDGELLALLGALEPDEITPALEFLKTLPPPAPMPLTGAVLMRWASFDAPAAMEWTRQLTAVQRDEVRGGILSAWARQDPKAAWQWYRKAWADAPEPRYRMEQDFPLLIHAWATQDLKGALEACLTEEKHGTFDGWSGFGSIVVIDSQREALLELITTGITDEKKRQAALRSTLHQWAGKDPAAAAAWLDQYAPAKDDGNFVWSIAERFGRADPQANADWLLRRTPPEKRDEIMSYALPSWARAEPEAAEAWLERAGPSDTGAQIMATSLAGRDLDRAVGWASRVSAPKRKDAIASVLATATTAGKKPDVSKYAAAAGITADELAKLVERMKHEWGMRL